jgi:hypothetical protein
MSLSRLNIANYHQAIIQLTLAPFAAMFNLDGETLRQLGRFVSHQKKHRPAGNLNSVFFLRHSDGGARILLVSIVNSLPLSRVTLRQGGVFLC